MMNSPDYEGVSETEGSDLPVPEVVELPLEIGDSRKELQVASGTSTIQAIQ